MISQFFLRIIFFLFDFFQVALSIVDTISDTWVAYEYYEQERFNFFYAVIICVFLGSVSEAVAFAIALDSNNHLSLNNPVKWIVVVGLLTPFGMILGPLHWILMNVFGERYYSDFSEKVNWKENENGKRTDASTATAASTMTDSSAAKNQDTLIKLDNFVTSRQASFMVSNIAAITESVPQCIIQLIGISMADGEATTVAIASLTLSLVSITIKAFQLCRSWNFRVFFAKVLFISMDVFKLAFISATLLSSRGPVETTLFGDMFGVSNLSKVWFVVKIANVSFCLFIALSIVLSEFSRNNSDPYTFLGAASAMIVLGIIPVAIIQEAGSFSYFIMFCFGTSVPISSWKKLPLLHEFLWTSHSSTQHDDGTGDANNNNNDDGVDDDDAVKKQNLRLDLLCDWRRTFLELKNELRRTVDEELKKVQKKFGTRNISNAFSFMNTYNMKIKEPIFSFLRRSQQPFSNNEELKQQQQQPYNRDDVFARLRFHWLCTKFWDLNGCLKTFYVSSYNTYNMNKNNNKNNKPHDAVDSFLDKTFDTDFLNDKRHEMFLDGSFGNNGYFDLIKFFLPTKQDALNSYSKKELVLILLISICCFITSIVSLSYPFFWWYWYRDTATTIQWICFAPFVFCFCSSLFLIPDVIRYQITQSFQFWLTTYQHDILEDIETEINTYFCVPLRMIRQIAVTDENIPSDCVDNHVLPFLSADHVHFFGLFGKELREVQNAVAEIQMKKKNI